MTRSPQAFTFSYFRSVTVTGGYISLVELAESKAKDPMAQLKARTAASAVGP